MYVAQITNNNNIGDKLHMPHNRHNSQSVNYRCFAYICSSNDRTICIAHLDCRSADCILPDYIRLDWDRLDNLGYNLLPANTLDCIHLDCMLLPGCIHLDHGLPCRDRCSIRGCSRIQLLRFDPVLIHYYDIWVGAHLDQI